MYGDNVTQLCTTNVSYPDVLIFTATGKLLLEILAWNWGALDFAHPAHPTATPLLGRELDLSGEGAIWGASFAHCKVHEISAICNDLVDGSSDAAARCHYCSN